MAINDFQYGGWNSYTLQCGMWLWNHDSEFIKWQQPAMWHVALGSWHWIRQVAPVMWQVALRWHATEYAQMSAILEFYIWFRFRPYHPMQSTCHSAPVYEFLCKSNHHRQKKMMSCRFSRWQISAILDFRDLIMGSLNSPRTTSYESSIETIALNCLVFEKITFFLYFGDRQTNK